MENKNPPKTVKVFSTPACPWCVRVKDYLRQNNIAFEDIDVSQNPIQAAAMVVKSGSQGVPQLWIGNEVAVGFDKPRIDMLLNL